MSRNLRAELKIRRAFRDGPATPSEASPYDISLLGVVERLLNPTAIAVHLPTVVILGCRRPGSALQRALQAWEVVDQRWTRKGKLL